jgi:hypothetical protein
MSAAASSASATIPPAPWPRSTASPFQLVGGNPTSSPSAAGVHPPEEPAHRDGRRDLPNSHRSGAASATRRRPGSIDGRCGRPARRPKASGRNWRSSCVRLHTFTPSERTYGWMSAASSRTVARSTPSSSAHRSCADASGPAVLEEPGVLSHGRSHRFETCHAHQHKRPPHGVVSRLPPASCQGSPLGRGRTRLRRRRQLELRQPLADEVRAPASRPPTSCSRCSSSPGPGPAALKTPAVRRGRTRAAQPDPGHPRGPFAPQVDLPTRVLA